MRLFPPVVFNAKVANKHCTLPKGGGSGRQSPVLVRKGDIVVFSTWASHRLGNQFGENPESFYPERWENLGGEIPGYIPFNMGPRVCPGRKFIS
jgi:cytochrome P450